MELIDDEGDLFGRVNVVDALAVLLVLAVVVAGLAVVGILSGAEGEPESRYTTIDLGSQPEYVAEQIDAGDEVPLETTNDSLTITDVYRSPPGSDANDSDDATVVVRAEVRGQLVERETREDPVFEYGGERLRVGRQLAIDTLEYTAEGRVTNVGEENPNLPTGETRVLLETTVSDRAAAEIDAGDEFRVAGQTVATVETVESYRVDADRRRVLVGVTLATLQRDGTPRFAGDPVTVGAAVSIRTDAYDVDAEVLRRGTFEQPGESATRYASIDFGTVPEYVADRVEAGDDLEIAGFGDNLTVTDVYAAPADGDVALAVRAKLTGQSVVREGREDPVFEFGGDPLRVGEGIQSDSLEYALEGEVTSLDLEGSELPVEETPVLLEATMPTRTADEVDEGDEFRVAGQTVATVETVQTYPVENDRRRVLVGASLSTLKRGGERTFAGGPITIDSTIAMRTDAYNLSAAVVRRGALEEAGEETTTAVELELENVRPETVESLSAGMTETERGRTLATIQSVANESAEIILESEDGNIYARDHPTNQDVTLEIDLETRETESGLRFHGESLREGETIVLDFGTIVVEGNVTAIDRS